MNKKDAIRLIKSTNGRIFSAEFIKKDGSIRRINARLGVKKGVKGVGMSYNPTDYGLIIAYDMKKRAFRMININTLKRIRFNGDYVIKEE